MHLGTRHNTSLPITAQAIWDGQAILATDGSVKDSKATYAWIISTNNDQITPDIQGGGILPLSAQYAKHASKRPEAAALYAALQWISTLLRRYPDNTTDAGDTPALPIPIDNKSVIDDIHRPINELTPTFQLLTPDFDIIQAIRQLINDLPITVDIFHVKSHQDRDKPFDDLTPYAQMNVLADRYAEYLHLQPETTIGIFPSWLPGTKAALFHGPSPITSDIPTYIRRAAHEPHMREYLIARSQQATNRESKWNDQIYDTIAWDHIGEVLRKLPIGRRIQLSKYMNDLLPTAKRLQTFDNRHDG
jgi:hypothetical protein